MYNFFRINCINKESLKKIAATLLSLLVVFSGMTFYNSALNSFAKSKSKSESRKSNLEIQRERVHSYFDDLHAYAVGNPETGEIYFANKSTEKFPIASISKLMTYLLVMEAMDSGEISRNGKVTISKEAEGVTYSYGMIWLKEGMKVPIKDLIQAMLIPSSNESAVALACHVSGSQEQFAKLMNKRAKELGLNSTHFYTASGLPTNLDDDDEDEYILPSKYLKTENHSSAEDLFKLASFIMKKYPQITKITSKKDITLEQFSFHADSTNTLLKEDNSINGLKTGSTPGAGRCIIITKNVKTDFKRARDTGKTMVVLLGANSVSERNNKARVLLNLGDRIFKAQKQYGITPMLKLKIPENIPQLTVQEKKAENKKSFIIKIIEFAVSIVVAIILLIILMRYIIRRRRRRARLIMSKRRYRRR